MTLSAADRLEIRSLLTRYETASRVDPGDERASYLKIFTEDAVLDGARGYWEGVDGILAFDRQIRAADGFLKVRTRQTNFLVEGDGGQATLRCCWFKVKRLPDGAPDIVTGDYECEVRRTSAGWRISKRIVRIDGLPQWKDTPYFNSSKKYVLYGDHYRLEDVAQS